MAFQPVVCADTFGISLIGNLICKFTFGNRETFIAEYGSDSFKRKFTYIRGKRHGHITRKEYIEINHVSVRIAYEELKDLTNNGLLHVRGKGRGTKYVQKVND